MKRFLLALAALAALSQSAFALGETKGLGNIFGGASSASTGVVDVVGTKGADPTCVRDSVTAIQSGLTEQQAKAIAAQDNYRGGPVSLQPGCYKMGSSAVTSASAGLQIYPANPIIHDGPVKLDYRDAPSGTRAIQISAFGFPIANSTTAMGQGSAAFGYAVDGFGMLGVFGRTGDANSIGLSVGNVTSGGDVGQNTRAGARNMYIEGFGWGLWFDPYNTFLNSFDMLNIRNSYNACIGFADTGDGTVTNSGENISIRRFVCSGGQNQLMSGGVIYGTSARNVNFSDASFDFNKGSAFHYPELPGFAGYMTSDCDICHVENADRILTSSETQPFFLHWNADKLYYVPGKNRNSGANNQLDRPLFDAPGVNVAINNWDIGLTSGTYSGISGLYLMTSPTVLSKLGNVDFQGFRNLIHESLNPYDGWNFRNSATGQFRFDSVADLYVKNQSSGLDIAVIISNTQPELGFGQKRIQINPNGNSFVDLWTPLYDVTPGARIFGGPVVYGGSTSAALNYTQQYWFGKPMFKPDPSITTVTKSTNNLAFVVTDGARLESNTLVCPYNIQFPEYANKCWPLNSVAGNTGTLRVSSTYPTPLPVTGTQIGLHLEQVTLVTTSAVGTVDISSTAGNTSDGAYVAGSRARWFLWEMNKTVTRTNDLRVPAGASVARLLLSFSANATTAYEIGGITLNQIQ